MCLAFLLFARVFLLETATVGLGEVSVAGGVRCGCSSAMPLAASVSCDTTPMWTPVGQEEERKEHKLKIEDLYVSMWQRRI